MTYAVKNEWIYDWNEATPPAMASADVRYNRVSACGMLPNGSISDLYYAERLYQRARLDFVRVQTQRYLDTAQLFLALGGTEL